jgi:cytochrome c
MRIWTIMLALAAFAVAPLAATASPNGTRAEAQAMVEKAAALLTAEGNDKAFATFDDRSGPFVDGDLYIFVQDFKGTTLAHGVNKALIGKNLLNVKDADGKLFVQEFVSVATTKGEGWVDYKWPNPTSKKIESKSSFVKKVGDYIIGCGVYND